MRISTTLGVAAAALCLLPAQAFAADAGDVDQLFSGDELTSICNLEPEACAKAQAAYAEAADYAHEAFGHRALQVDAEAGTRSGDHSEEAVTHCVWQGLTMLREDEGFAERVADGFEADNTASEQTAQRNQHNNRAGRELAASAAGEESHVFEACTAAADDGTLDIAQWQVL